MSQRTSNTYSDFVIPFHMPQFLKLSILYPNWWNQHPSTLSQSQEHKVFPRLLHKPIITFSNLFLKYFPNLSLLLFFFCLNSSFPHLLPEHYHHLLIDFPPLILLFENFPCTWSQREITKHKCDPSTTLLKTFQWFSFLALCHSLKEPMLSIFQKTLKFSSFHSHLAY